jgi:predicted tellurium resistance membrane protein TerC
MIRIKKFLKIAIGCLVFTVLCVIGMVVTGNGYKNGLIVSLSTMIAVVVLRYVLILLVAFMEWVDSTK